MNSGEVFALCCVVVGISILGCVSITIIGEDAEHATIDIEEEDEVEEDE